MSSTTSEQGGVRFVRVPRTGCLEVDLSTGPAASYAGLRRALSALRDAGATFGTLSQSCPPAWRVLFPGSEPSGGPAAVALSDIALSASERRLHRESEQTFRVLVLAARALCHGAAELDRPVLLRGVAGTDLASLRGLIRAAEYARTGGTGELLFHADLAGWSAEAPETDYRDERIRCLRLIGFTPSGTGPPFAREVPPVTGTDPESALFRVASDPSGGTVERLTAALRYCHHAFYSGNWEGMAIVANSCLPLVEDIAEADVADLVAASADQDAGHAIEFEPTIIRHPGDVRGFLLKVLGIQATFRERQDDAIGFFRSIRHTDLTLSPEIRSQGRLYTALTLTKRKHLLDEAVAELEAGFAELREAGGADSVRRERGWLHNLRALTLFAAKDLVGALRQEKLALSSIDDLNDASSVHLRVNLVSNISVLQERAGKYRQASRTWGRFDTSATQQDTKFAKHHLYRGGGLRILAGDADEGMRELAESAAHCARLADDFHECEIAAELGTAMLDRGETAVAGRFYAQAEEAATRLGDPYRIALARAGRAVCERRPLAPERVAVAANSRTHAVQAMALLDAAAAGATGDRVRALLPSPRTKLNRPFDLVNF